MRSLALHLRRARGVLRRRWTAVAFLAVVGLCGGLVYAVVHAPEPSAAVRVRLPRLTGSGAEDVLLGLVAGLLVGTVAVLILARRNHRLRRRDQITRATGLPVLAYMDAEQYQNAADWIRLLERFEPSALNALILRRVLRHLVPLDWQGPFTIRVLSFAGDQAALDFGPELALFAAGSGIPTRLAPDENIALEPMISACAVLRTSKHPDHLLSFGTEREDLRGPKYRPTRWWDDPALIQPNLVVSVVAVDPLRPELPSTVGPTVLALSSGFAFVDDLARVMQASTRAGLEIEGVVVVNPDPNDITTSLLPGHRYNGSKAHDSDGGSGPDPGPPEEERQNGHRPPQGRHFQGYADTTRENSAEAPPEQRPLVGQHLNGHAETTRESLAEPLHAPRPLVGRHFPGTRDLPAEPPQLDGRHFRDYPDIARDVPAEPRQLDGRHFRDYPEIGRDVTAEPPKLDGRPISDYPDTTRDIPANAPGVPRAWPSVAWRQVLCVWAVGGRRARRLFHLVPERHQRKARFVLVSAAYFTVQFIILETLVHLGVETTTADLVAFSVSAQLNLALSSIVTWADRPARSGWALLYRIGAYNATAVISLLAYRVVFDLVHPHLGPVPGAAAGVLCGTVITYLACNSLIFRPGRREASAYAKESTPPFEPLSAPPTGSTSMNGVRRNMASLLLSQMATFALSVATIAIVPKRLGSESYGEFAVAISFVSFFILAATLGWGDFLVKKLAREPSELGRYIFNAFAVKSVYGLAIAAAAAVGARILRYPPEIILLIEICSISIVLTALFDVLGSGLQATQRFGKFAFWSAASRYASGLLAIILLLAHRGVVAYAVVVSSAAIIPVVAFARHLWPDIKPHVHLEPRLWKSIFAGGLPFFLWAVVLQIYSSIDVLMLQRMTNNNTVGWYSLAYTWVSIPIFFPGLLVAAVFPTLSSRAASRSPDFSPTVNKALQLTLLVTTPTAIGIALIAPNIITLFHYPAQFNHAVVLIRLLAIGMPIVAINMILGIAVIAIDRQKAWLLVGCVAVLFNPLVNLVAIPATSHHYGNGAIGASIVTVATELVLMAGAVLLRPAGVLDRQTLSFLLRTLLAGLAMIPTVLLVRNFPFEIMVAVGAATFAAASFSLGLVTPRTVRGNVSQLLSSVRDRGRLADMSSQVESQ